ncbi:hypothetical protein [Demequina sp. NBRC 110056]|uniref:hypothetical protein n=1 Tax=Demequina sp. NBRC 110056 TaxID=1570345 RepID=UPI0009FC7466|nr:hypothetical protein [Demequina sp. NBRC 110056]
MTSPHPRSPAVVPAPDPFASLAYLAARDVGERLSREMTADHVQHHDTPRHRSPLDRLRRAGQVALNAVSTHTRRWADALDHGRPSAV